MCKQFEATFSRTEVAEGSSYFLVCCITDTRPTLTPSLSLTHTLSHTLSLHFTPSLYFEFVTLSVVSAVADAAATAVVVVFVVMGQSQFCPVVIEVVVVVAAVVDVDVVHLFARVYLFNSNASRRSRSIIFRSSIH